MNFDILSGWRPEKIHQPDLLLSLLCVLVGTPFEDYCTSHTHTHTINTHQHPKKTRVGCYCRFNFFTELSWQKDLWRCTNFVISEVTDKFVRNVTPKKEKSIR
jgi:hypothetical protein